MVVTEPLRRVLQLAAFAGDSNSNNRIGTNAAATRFNFNFGRFRGCTVPTRPTNLLKPISLAMRDNATMTDGYKHFGYD